MPQYHLRARFPLGEDAAAVPLQVPIEVLQAQMKTQEALLNDVRQRIEEELLWRKIATVATLAGTAIAAVRLTEIWVTLRRKG